MASELYQNIRAAKSQLPMKAIIEKEIKWCEENRGMKGEVYEEAFIAGLKQVLFFINEIEKHVAVDDAPAYEILDLWSDWYDSQDDDEFLQMIKTDISQMSFFAGYKAAQNQAGGTTPSVLIRQPL